MGLNKNVMIVLYKNVVRLVLILFKTGSVFYYVDFCFVVNSILIGTKKSSLLVKMTHQFF